MTAAPTGGLAGRRRTPFTAAGSTHAVYEQGSGPGVALVDARRPVADFLRAPAAGRCPGPREEPGHPAPAAREQVVRFRPDRLA